MKEGYQKDVQILSINRGQAKDPPEKSTETKGKKERIRIRKARVKTEIAFLEGFLSCLPSLLPLCLDLSCCPNSTFSLFSYLIIGGYILLKDSSRLTFGYISLLQKSGTYLSFLSTA